MSQIVIESKPHVRVIRMTRPEKKNALTAAMYTEMAGALAAAGDDADVHAVVITGVPGMFTAGNDLLDFMQQPPAGEDSPAFVFLHAIASCPKPVIAAVDGVAVGIGTTMLLHCDLVVATSSATFAVPFTKLALTAEGGSSLLLPLTVGYQRASEWLLTGDTFSADAALSAGLVNRVVAPDALEATAMAFANTIASRPPEAVVATKRLLKEAMHAEVMTTMAREGRVFVERLTSREAQAAFAAFLSR